MDRRTFVYRFEWYLPKTKQKRRRCKSAKAREDPEQRGGLLETLRNNPDVLTLRKRERAKGVGIEARRRAWRAVTDKHTHIHLHKCRTHTQTHNKQNQQNVLFSISLLRRRRDEAADRRVKKENTENRNLVSYTTPLYYSPT